MKRIKVKSENINGMVKALEFDIMSLVYSTNDPDEDDRSDMEIVTTIHDRINDILTEVAAIESERDRQKELASKLRKQWGAAFNEECNKAGIL